MLPCGPRQLSPAWLRGPRGLQGLRDRFVSEMGQAAVTPYAGEVLGMMAALITRCEHLGMALQRIYEHDAPAYDSFLRTPERG